MWQVLSQVADDKFVVGGKVRFISQDWVGHHIILGHVGGPLRQRNVSLENCELLCRDSLKLCALEEEHPACVQSNIMEEHLSLESNLLLVKKVNVEWHQDVVGETSAALIISLRHEALRYLTFYCPFLFQHKQILIVQVYQV